MTTYKSLFEEYNHAFLSTLPADNQISNAIRYSLGFGKRIRPIIMLAICDDIQCRSNTILPTALGVEMLHSASLIIDDLPDFDNATHRRGLLACHKKYSPKTAILTALELLTRSFPLILNIENTKCKDFRNLFSLLDQYIRVIGIDGMIGSQDFEKSKKTLKKSEYLSLNDRKTGNLFQFATKATAIHANCSKSVQNELEQIGNCLGQIYQIADDLTDGDKKVRKGTEAMISMATELKTKMKTILIRYPNLKNCIENILDCESSSQNS